MRHLVASLASHVPFKRCDILTHVLVFLIFWPVLVHILSSLHAQMVSPSEHFVLTTLRAALSEHPNNTFDITNTSHNYQSSSNINPLHVSRNTSSNSLNNQSNISTIDIFSDVDGLPILDHTFNIPNTNCIGNDGVNTTTINITNDDTANTVNNTRVLHQHQSFSNSDSGPATITLLSSSQESNSAMFSPTLNSTAVMSVEQSTQTLQTCFPHCFNDWKTYISRIPIPVSPTPVKVITPSPSCTRLSPVTLVCEAATTRPPLPLPNLSTVHPSPVPFNPPCSSSSREVKAKLFSTTSRLRSSTTPRNAPAKKVQGHVPHTFH